MLRVVNGWSVVGRRLAQGMRVAAVVAATGFAPALAAPAIDGDLRDWNVTLRDQPAAGCVFSSNAAICHSSTWTAATIPTVSSPGWTSFAFSHEDTNDVSNSYVVGPNSGGQDFDVEFLAGAVMGNRLYLAISNGQRPDNSFAAYEPGDILIKIPAANGSGVRTYGVEVGGGAGGLASGNVAAGGAITEGAPGSTYVLNQVTASTQSVAPTPALQTAGSVWLTTIAPPPHPTVNGTETGGQWIYDPLFGGPVCPADPFCGKQPTQFDISLSAVPDQRPDLAGYQAGPVTVADYVYARNATPRGDLPSQLSLQHSVIEVSIDLEPLFYDIQPGQLIEFVVEWGTSCGNDKLNIALANDPPLEPRSDTVPAPWGGMVSIAFLALAVALPRRRHAGATLSA